MSARGDGWFQGRELVEALEVRLALPDTAAAFGRFRTAVALAERYDVYAAAWLVAECAAPLAAAGVTEVHETVARYAAEVDGHGFTSLAARYAAVRGA